MKCALCVLTCNAAPMASAFLEAVAAQTLHGLDRLVIDSSSDDGTGALFASAGFRVHSIPRAAFDHGGTRRLATELCPAADILILMTQDALPATPEALRNLVAAFADPETGAAFGRQLPRPGATPLEAHARLFNYPPASQVKSAADIPVLGIKTAFMSNSFAAYRCSALRDAGGFPSDNIVSEDTYVAARLLESGWKIRYCAEATVYHSHDYNLLQEFRRYFDLGVFHARAPWIRQRFGAAEGEGRRFVVSQLAWLAHENRLLIPVALARTLAKYLGYRLGFCEAALPNRLKMWLSTQKNYWDRN